jgi:DNA-binding MarR family transcriptional regulator
MDAEADAVEWMRRRWKDEEQPAPEHFAAMTAVLRTHQRIVADLEEVLKPNGFGLTTYLLMATLQMSDAHTRPLGQLSRHLMIHPTSVTLVVDRLEEKGLVRRRPHPTDRRTVLATLTQAGVASVQRINSELAATRFGLGETKVAGARQLREVLRDVRASLGDVSPPPPAG